GEGLARQAERADVVPVRLAAGHRRGEPPGLPERAHQAAARAVHVLVIDEARQLAVRPGAQLLGPTRVPGTEERPGEVGEIGHAQFPSNTGRSLAEKARKARAKSSVVMHRACATASASIASSIDIAHSTWSIRFVIACANDGPLAISRASARAAPSSSSGSTRRLKKPQRSPSSPGSARPV